MSSLLRTKVALARYDRLEPGLRQKLIATRHQDNVRLLDDLIERLGEDVGWAFGLDTADFNSVEDCRKLVRPGPPVPAPGCELSFVRRMVAESP